MNIEPEIQDANDAVALTDVKGTIDFENVSFQYKDNQEKVLNRINLHVPAGAYMALVGSSGAGKTTLCSLNPRFYDVTGGCIRVDGKDVRKVTLKSLRDHIGMVQQDVYLFAGNIMENIRYGRPDATDEEVIRAAKLANAHDFIMEMPDNYATDIGQRGVKLSGGQKQRVAIARAIVNNPKLLLADEPTGALDSKSGAQVMELFQRLNDEGVSVLMITHDADIAAHAKRVVTIKDGILQEKR